MDANILQFDCCGYVNATTPPFVQDQTCTNSLVAAQKGGCIAPFSSFTNKYLDQIFTAAFGIVGIDFILVLCVAMVLKYRMEQERKVLRLTGELPAKQKLFQSLGILGGIFLVILLL